MSVRARPRLRERGRRAKWQLGGASPNLWGGSVPARRRYEVLQKTGGSVCGEYWGKCGLAQQGDVFPLLWAPRPFPAAGRREKACFLP